MKSNVDVSYDEKSAEVIAENRYYRLALGKDIGGFICNLDLKTGDEKEPLATSRLLALPPVETSDPSKLLLEVMNTKVEDWVPIEPESFHDVDQTCEERNDKTELKFHGEMRIENLLGKPELKYWLNYLLEDSPTILVSVGFQRVLDDLEVVPVMSSLEFLDPGGWIINSAEAVLSEDSVVRHPLQKSIYSDRTGLPMVDKYWLSPLYPLSFSNPVLGIEKRNRKCSVLIGDESGSSRNPESAFFLEADKLGGDWVLCLRTLNLGSELDYSLFPRAGPLGRLEDFLDEGKGMTRTFNWTEPFIDVSGANYEVKNRYLKAVFRRNRGGCIGEVVLKSGSKPVESISGSNLLVAGGIYDPRFFFTILNWDKNVDAAKCLTPFITQERKGDRLVISYHGYLSQLGPASFSVPAQRIQYYFRYGLGSSAELHVTVGIKPSFEPKLEAEDKAFGNMIADWLGFKPDYEKLFKKASILLRLSLPDVEEYTLVDEKGSSHTSTAEGHNEKKSAPRDRSVKRIDVRQKGGKMIRFTDLTVWPETCRPRIYVADGQKFDVCVAWLDEEAYHLKKDNWYEIGFKTTFMPVTP